MKKRFTVMLLALATLLPMLAQEVEVVSRQRLLEGVKGPAYYPVLNATGDRLLFATDAGALKMHDLVDGVTTVVLNDPEGKPKLVARFS